MLKRLTLILSIVAISVAAVAQNAGVVGLTHGRALLASEDKRVATTSFEVVKHMRGDKEVLRGHLMFSQRPTADTPVVEIVMENPLRLGIEGNVAKFAGPAALRVITRAGAKVVRGRVVVTVVDNKRPGGTEEVRDLFAIEFTPNEAGKPPFAFRGAVREGDLVVRSK